MGRTFRIMIITGIFFLIGFTPVLADSLEGIYVFPNPCRVSQGNNQMVFTNLPSEVELEIYTLDGQQVREVYENDSSGEISWDLRNQDGEIVASGVYFYLLRSGDDYRVGKLIILR